MQTVPTIQADAEVLIHHPAENRFVPSKQRVYFDLLTDEPNPTGDRMMMTLDERTYIISRKEFKKVFKAMKKAAHEFYDIRSKAEEILFDGDDE